METDAVVVKDAREVFENETTLQTFSNLVEERLNAKEAIKLAEAIVKKVDDKLTVLLTDRDCDKVLYGRHRVGIISKENRRLDKELLMMNGVSVKVIEASMKVSHSSYLEVRELKDTKAATS